MKDFFRAFIPQLVLNKIRIWNQKVQLDKWRKNGYPAPPPHIVKQMTIWEYQEKYGYKVLVETGTFRGDMVEAQKKKFRRVFSIELGVDLFNKATRRFKNDKNVTIVQGDSGKVLHKILLRINEPAIFWLDGHYSAGLTTKGERDCPIFQELDAIFRSGKFNHIVLIDDARCFIGKEDYPTVTQLTEYVKSKNSKYHVEVENDMIRCVI